MKFKTSLMTAAILLALSTSAHATNNNDDDHGGSSSGGSSSSSLINNPLTNISVSNSIPVSVKNNVDSNSNSKATSNANNEVSTKQNQLQTQKQTQGFDVSGLNTSVSGDNVNVMYIPSHGVQTPTSVVPSTKSIQSTTGCGVMHKVKREVINGKYFNLIAAPTDVNLGYTDTLIPSDVPFKTYSVGKKSYLIGHEVIMTTTPISISGARQFGLGGNNDNGGGGSGSIGSSGAMNQVVTTIQLRECVFAEGAK
jgi:hypothetical protein